MALFRDVEESDWVGEELPVVYAMIGPQAIEPLAKFLARRFNGSHPRIGAAFSLERIANQHPEAREQCVQVLIEQLQRYRKDDLTVNGFVINYLMDLRAVEALPLIRQAFEDEYVDLSIVGDVEDAEIYFGVRERRSTPARNYLFPKVMNTGSSEDDDEMTPIPRAQSRKIGRNEPCPCGSGKKYKKCCLNKQSSM
ncbi:MAG: SEC-C metal-binding domain-containing protein [bacterium]